MVRAIMRRLNDVQRVGSVVVPLLSLITSGCSSTDTHRDQLREHQQFLTVEQSRVLGFESPVADWSTSNGATVSASVIVTEGNASLAVSPNGWTEITSRAIPATGMARDTASFDLRLPQTLSWGTAQLVLQIPSQNVNWADLGQRNLETLPPGEFHNLEFSLPGHVQAALNSTAGDLTFKIIINAEQGAGTFIVDNLVVSDASPASEDPDAVEHGEELKISLPVGLHPHDVVIGTSESFQIRDRARVIGGPGEEPATVANSGAGEAYLGVESKVGSVVSSGHVELRNQALVDGDLKTSDSFHAEPDATVTGKTTEGADLEPFADAAWIPTYFVGPGTEVHLEPDQSQALQPGTYGALHINSRSTVTLAPGVYKFDNVTLEPESKLLLSVIDQPTVIYIDGAMIHRGLVASEQDLEYDSLPLLVVALGTQDVTIERSFNGTIYAPNAQMRVIGGPHTGAFFGKSVELQPDALVVHRPFPWSYILPAPGTCSANIVDVVGVGGDLLDLFRGNETLPGGKKVEHLPEIQVIFSEPVEPALVGAYLVGQISTTESGNCEDDPQGPRQRALVKLSSDKHLLERTVNLVPAEPLKLGCQYSLHVQVDVPVSSGGACLTEKFDFDHIMVEHDIDSTRSSREFARAIRRHPQDTIGVLEIQNGVNTPVMEALERYVVELGLLPGRHSFVEPGQLGPSEIHPGMEQGYYQLTYDGVPVRGHGLTIDSENGFLRHAFGKLARTDITTIPVVNESEAIANVMAEHGVAPPYPWDTGASFSAPQTELSVEEAVNHIQSKTDYRLTWRLNFEGAGVLELGAAAVDATSGQVLSRLPLTRDCTLQTGDTLDEGPLRPGGVDTPLDYGSTSPFNMSVLPPHDPPNPNADGTWFTQDSIDYRVFARKLSGWSFEVGQAPIGDQTDHLIPDGALECDPNGDGVVNPTERTDKVFPLATTVFAAADKNAELLDAVPFTVFGANYAGLSNHTPKSEQVAKLWVGDYNGTATSPLAYYHPSSPPHAPMLYFVTNSSDEAAHSTVSHEMGHAISHGVRRTIGSDNVEYEGESGALEEGFADIMSIWFGQNDVDPFEYTSAAGIFKRLDDPAVTGRPAMYEEAANWKPIAATCNSSNDYCEVHNNSAVFSHWFNIVSEGRAASPNQLGCYPDLAPIDPSLPAAIRKAFQLTVDAWALIGKDAGYEEMREATSYAAQEYGAAAAQTVSHAWYAVGVFGGMDPTTHTGRTPVNGATAVEPWDAHLTWEVPADGAIWRYQVATDAAFTDVVAEGNADGYGGAGTREAYADVSLSASTKYYWRYMAANANDWSKCSVVPLEFTTKAKKINMQVPAVQTTTDPTKAVTVASQATGLLITNNDSQQRKLEWGIGECDAPEEFDVYDGVGRASIGNDFLPEHPEFDQYAKLRTGSWDSEQATLVYVREIKDAGNVGSCSYFKIRVPAVQPFHVTGHGEDSFAWTWEDFDDVEISWTSAGPNMRYEVTLYNLDHDSESLDPQGTFQTTSRSVRASQIAANGERGTGLWFYNVKARSPGMSKSTKGFRWAVENTPEPLDTGIPPSRFYAVKAGEVVPIVENYLTYDKDARRVTVQRPWDNGQPGSEGEAFVSYQNSPGNAHWLSVIVREPNAESVFFYATHERLDSWPNSTLSVDPIPGSDAQSEWELTSTGYSWGPGGNSVYADSAGPTTTWTLEFEEEAPECIDPSTDFWIPGMGYLPTTGGRCRDVAVPFDIPEGGADGYQGPFDVGEAILDDCVNRIPVSQLASSFPAVPNAYSYEYTIGQQVVFADGHTSEVWQTVDIPYVSGNTIRPAPESITWRDIPRRHGVPTERREEAKDHAPFGEANGLEYFEGCVAAITIRAKSHPDCGEDSFVDSRASWIFVDAGTHACDWDNDPSMGGGSSGGSSSGDFCDDTANVGNAACQSYLAAECSNFSSSLCQAWAAYRCQEGHGQAWCNL